MKIEYIPLEATGKFSKFMTDFAQHKQAIDQLISDVCEGQDIPSALARQQNMSKEIRQVLTQSLTQQYLSVNASSAVIHNISLLNVASTFTVSCGHQLNIFGGPMYVFFKIATVIQLCKHLKTTYPQYDFVPVHWMATEDHDVEEISYVQLFGKKISWQTNQTGCTGDLNTQDLLPFMEEIADLPEVFKAAYSKNNNLADATRYYLNEVFGEDGLVILDANQFALKSIFKAVMKDEIKNQTAEKRVEQSNTLLTQMGYSPQVHARAINLFYLQPGSRERIIKLEDGTYSVLNTPKSWTEEEILIEIEQQPEHFSPNVVLRPLYSQMILPDVAFVGGPAEIAYWLQLTHLFAHYHVPFPVLVPRLFGMIVNSAVEKKMQNLGITVGDVFKPEHELRQALVEKAGLLPDFDTLLHQPLKTGFEAIQSAVNAIDTTLEASVQAEYIKVQKMIEALEKRIEKAGEKRLETDINSLKNVLGKLLPGNGLQERHDGWLQYYINMPNFKETVLNAYKPFSADLSIMYT